MGVGCFIKTLFIKTGIGSFFGEPVLEEQNFMGEDKADVFYQ